MDTFAPLWPVVRVGLLLAGLLLPGVALARALRVPVTLAVAFTGSALALYVAVLALQLTGLPLSPATLAGSLLAVTLGAAFAARRATPRNPPARLPSTLADAAGDESVSAVGALPSGRFAPWTGLGGWLPLYGLCWAAVLWRAGVEPVAGPDVEFRWGFLAEQMLRLGTLDFYPPRAPADFTAYFWVESIPPGPAALHAWAFACAGGPHLAWALPGVVLQLLALHELVWHVAHRFGGVPAARCAVLAAAATPLLTWAVLIGQETGLTSLALVGLVFALGRWQETGDRRWAALAGGFGLLGASAREYGLVFPVLAGLGLLLARADRRAWGAFLAVAALSLVWPLRVWLLTGNPFFSLGAAGLLPVNERFVAWIGADAAVFGATLQSAAGWRDFARYLVLFAPAATAGWIALVFAAGRRRPGALFALVGVAAVLALWFASVPYTNGGLFYSLRVTSPALALGAVAAGVAVGAAAGRVGLGRFGQALLTGLALAALPGTLALPASPWRESWSSWPAFRAPVRPPTGTDDPTVALVLQARAASPEPGPAGAGPVLADSPGYQRRFLPVGIPVVPLWSPQADWLFDLTLPPGEAARRWRESGIRYLVVTKWQAHLDFLNRHSRWNRPPFRVQLRGETPATAVFSIRAED